MEAGLLVRRHGDVYVLPGPRTPLCEDAAPRLAGGPAAVTLPPAQHRRLQGVMVALGWTVLRFTWWDLRNRPDYVVATVLAAVARAS